MPAVGKELTEGWLPACAFDVGGLDAELFACGGHCHSSALVSGLSSSYDSASGVYAAQRSLVTAMTPGLHHDITMHVNEHVVHLCR